jgi:hypothetical protein
VTRSKSLYAPIKRNIPTIPLRRFVSKNSRIFICISIAKIKKAQTIHLGSFWAFPDHSLPHRILPPVDSLPLKA